ncbi:MAG: hypothetical protein EA001_06245 [Oscillatoriales cyanobacterium]|nr:MAG: hypothetical protein EA001_06245 [Oscillatoriales cyanobacterium]
MRKPINLAITTAMIVLGLQMVIPRSTPVARAARIRCPEASLGSSRVKHSLHWLAQAQLIAGQLSSIHLPLPNPLQGLNWQGFNSLPNVPSSNQSGGQLGNQSGNQSGNQLGNQLGPESNPEDNTGVCAP